MARSFGIAGVCFAQTQWPDEKYKWEAVKCFQVNWDVNSDDFAGMLTKALSQPGNHKAHVKPDYQNNGYAAVEPIDTTAAAAHTLSDIHPQPQSGHRDCHPAQYARP